MMLQQSESDKTKYLPKFFFLVQSFLFVAVALDSLSLLAQQGHNVWVYKKRVFSTKKTKFQRYTFDSDY